MKTKKLLIKLFALTLLFNIHITASAQVQWTLDTVISMGTNPEGIAITPDNSKIIVTNNTSPGTIKIIAASNYSITSISYPADAYPNGVAITPDGTTALVNTTHQTIYIDLAANSVSGNFPAPCVGTTLYGIAVNGSSAIYPDLSSGCTQGGLRSINASPPSSGSTFILDNSGGQLYGIAIAHDGVSAIVTGFSTHGPTNVNLSTSGVQNISGMTQSYGIAALHNTNEVLVYDGDSLDRVSLISNTVIKKITNLSFNSCFQNIAITADDKYAFAVGGFEKKIIDLDNNTVIQTLTSGQFNVAVMSDGSKFFVTDKYNGTVRVYKKVSSTGIDNLQKRIFNAIVYPNPGNGRFSLTLSPSFTGTNSEEGTVEIYNVMGEKVYQSIYEPINQLTIDMSSKPKGIYFLKLVMKAAGGTVEQIHSEKIVIQ